MFSEGRDIVSDKRFSGTTETQRVRSSTEVLFYAELPARKRVAAVGANAKLVGSTQALTRSGLCPLHGNYKGFFPTVVSEVVLASDAGPFVA